MNLFDFQIMINLSGKYYTGLLFEGGQRTEFTIYHLYPNQHQAEICFTVPVQLVHDSTEEHMKSYCNNKIAAWLELRKPFDKSLVDLEAEYGKTLARMTPDQLYHLYFEQQKRRDECDVPGASIMDMPLEAIKKALQSQYYFINKGGQLVHIEDLWMEEAKI